MTQIAVGGVCDADEVFQFRAIGVRDASHNEHQDFVIPGQITSSPIRSRDGAVFLPNDSRRLFLGQQAKAHIHLREMSIAGENVFDSQLTHYNERREVNKRHCRLISVLPP